MRSAPAKRKSITPKKGGSTRQPEIHQGTSPATKPGAMTRKTIVPKIANTLTRWRGYSLPITRVAARNS
jgi:hypothetical protein